MQYILYPNVTFFFAEKVFKVTPRELTKRLGETVTFICKDVLRENWTFKRGPLPSNAEVSRYSTSYDSWLTITNIIMENIGTYTCTGIDINQNYFEDDGILMTNGKT